MLTGDGSALAAALRSAAPSEHARWLGEADEPALQELPRARDGELYASPDLYAPGELYAGFMFHRGRNHAESGLSLVPLSLISFNLPYPFQHVLDHHRYPHVPGYHLPTHHHHLRPALLERGAPVFDNCLAVTLDDDVALVSLRRRST